MKLIKFSLLTIVMFTLSAMFCACSDDDNTTTPITLKDKEDTTFKINYPTDHEYRYIIEGGDGDYSVKTDNPEVIVPEIIKLTEASSSNQNLRLKVIGLGFAQVTITDKSQNSRTLDITVDYKSDNYKVKLIDVRVTGGDLTENQKKVIEEKELARNPVKVGGGYRFIFNDTPNKKGEASIYSITHGQNASKVVFNTIEYGQPIFPNSYSWGYGLTINNEERNFVLGMYYPKTRDLAPQIMALIEDVTESVQKEYPKAESVIIFQVVEIRKY